jgi:poly(3-hydroxybutyrate) depolymerase
MTYEFALERTSAADAKKSDGGFFTGFAEAFRHEYDGARQLFGADVDLTYMQNDNTSEAVGKFVGNAAMFIGSTVLAKRFMGGRAASVAVGGALGFLAPVNGNQTFAEQMTDRALMGGVGAATVGTLEFMPAGLGLLKPLAGDTFKAGLGRAMISNATAGAIQTEGSTYVNTGQHASVSDLAIGAATWAGTGAAFHSVGSLAGKYSSWKQEQATAKALTAEQPWQFKTVQQIDAADLTTGQKLAPGNYSVNFQSEGHQRSFNLYVSEKSAAGTAADAPVVTFLHGLTPKGTGPHIIRELSFNKFADDEGAIVAYLQGRDGRKGPLTGDVQNWNDKGFGYTKYDPSYNDNIAFGDMLGIIGRHVPNAHMDRVAVTGFSMGGKFANRLAATRDDIGALATIHGTVDAGDLAIMQSSPNLRPKDVNVILGDKDAVLPLDGGRSFWTFLLDGAKDSRPRAQAQFWGQQAAGDIPPLRFDGPNYTGNLWLSPEGHRVTQYIVKDGAHAIDGAHAKKNLIQWAMGEPKPPSYFDSRTITWDAVIRSLRRQIGDSQLYFQPQAAQGLERSAAAV